MQRKLLESMQKRDKKRRRIIMNWDQLKGFFYLLQAIYDMHVPLVEKAKATNGQLVCRNVLRREDGQKNWGQFNGFFNLMLFMTCMCSLLEEAKKTMGKYVETW